MLRQCVVSGGRACCNKHVAQQATLLPLSSLSLQASNAHASAASGASCSPACARPSLPAASRSPSWFPARARNGLTVKAAGAGASLEAPQAFDQIVSLAKDFYHLSETLDFHDFTQIVTPDIKWRQRGLLQGNRTLNGAEPVHKALSDFHSSYQDLKYTINMSAEESGRAVIFWTASGANRLPLFGKAATFHNSVFSGVSILYTAPDGRIKEIIEYRQPTHEEMHAFLRKDTGNPVVQRLLLRGHAVPSSYPKTPIGKEIDPQWRYRAVGVATEWVENWTAGPDLENMVREDMEEYNIFSWPDFESDLVGQDAIGERFSRNAQEAVVIRDTIADSASNLVAILWNDFERANEVHSWAEEHQQRRVQVQPSALRSGDEALPDRALPREQPTLHPEHGSVEKSRSGQLIVHLAQSTPSQSGTSIDEPYGEGPGLAGPDRLHKYRGVTLFGVDADCRLAWQVTFRELKASEEQFFLEPRTK